jgi:hypothetical protein
VESGGTTDEAPAAGLVRCEHVGGCLVCERTTPWRVVTFDAHICSAACYETAKEFLEARGDGHEH